MTKLSEMSKFHQAAAHALASGDDLNEQLDAFLEALESDAELAAEVEGLSKSRDRLKATAKSAFRKSRRAAK